MTELISAIAAGSIPATIAFVVMCLCITAVVIFFLYIAWRE